MSTLNGTGWLQLTDVERERWLAAASSATTAQQHNWLESFWPHYREKIAGLREKGIKVLNILNSLSKRLTHFSIYLAGITALSPGICKFFPGVQQHILQIAPAKLAEVYRPHQWLFIWLGLLLADRLFGYGRSFMRANFYARLLTWNVFHRNSIPVRGRKELELVLLALRLKSRGESRFIIANDLLTVLFHDDTFRPTFRTSSIRQAVVESVKYYRPLPLMFNLFRKNKLRQV